MPHISDMFPNEWLSSSANEIYDEVNFDSSNWKECVLTVNDLPNFVVKTITISESEYEKLLEAEKKLKEIQKFFD